MRLRRAAMDPQVGCFRDATRRLLSPLLGHIADSGAWWRRLIHAAKRLLLAAWNSEARPPVVATTTCGDLPNKRDRVHEPSALGARGRAMLAGEKVTR